MENNKADAVRIQTSVLNALEKKVLVWLAERQPKWMTSDILTYLGTFGAVIIAAGYSSYLHVWTAVGEAGSAITESVSSSIDLRTISEEE